MEKKLSNESRKNANEELIDHKEKQYNMEKDEK